MKVTHTQTTPPGTWRCRMPDGQAFSEITFDALLGKVTRWHAANGVEFDREKWEDELCRSLQIEESHCSTPTHRPGNRVNIGVAELRRFVETVKALTVANPEDRFVDGQEAERRAAICAACPMNLPVAGCWGCSGVVAMLKDALIGRTTSRDGNLESCQACGCVLRAKVWVGPEVLARVERVAGVDYPEGCWVPGVKGDQ